MFRFLLGMAPLLALVSLAGCGAPWEPIAPASSPPRFSAQQRQQSAEAARLGAERMRLDREAETAQKARTAPNAPR